jgi:hypothetical protein
MVRSSCRGATQSSATTMARLSTRDVLAVPVSDGLVSDGLVSDGVVSDGVAARAVRVAPSRPAMSRRTSSPTMRALRREEGSTIRDPGAVVTATVAWRGAPGGPARAQRPRPERMESVVARVEPEAVARSRGRRVTRTRRMRTSGADGPGMIRLPAGQRRLRGCRVTHEDNARTTTRRDRHATGRVAAGLAREEGVVGSRPSWPVKIAERRRSRQGGWPPDDAADPESAGPGGKPTAPGHVVQGWSAG